jgi:hypothetical protein
MPGLANGQRFMIPENSRRLSSGSGANARQNSALKSLFSPFIGFNQEKTVQFSGPSSKK